MKRLKISVSALIALSIGFFGFYLVIGPNVLIYNNIAWFSGDAAQHYLGWVFFRDSAWEFPLGSNPRNGLELASSIVYSDSNPLLAIALKPFSPFLPNTFQYFGFWVLSCFLLQALVSWQLLSLVTDNPIIRVLGSSLFVFAPPFLDRFGHLNLCAHFLILSALYLVITTDSVRRPRAWYLLLIIATLVHAYILAMVSLFWMASLARSTMLTKVSVRKSAYEAGVTILSVLLVAWQAGYFDVGTGFGSAGYGFYRMNLLSLIDAGRWSYILPDIAEGGGDYEGYNFLGLGSLLLLLAVVPVLVHNYRIFVALISKHALFAGALLALTFFALSHHIGIGPYDQFLPLPDFIIQTFGLFRASGRMFWPVYYMIVLSVIYLVIIGYRHRTAIIMLTTAMFLQIVDTSAGYRSTRNHHNQPPSAKWETELSHNFWQKAASHYSNIRRLPPSNIGPHWLALSYLAATNGLSTNAVYHARIHPRKMQKATLDAERMIRKGNYATDTLYVLSSDRFSEAIKTIDKQRDYAGIIDSLYVIAPGWIACDSCGKIVE